MNANDFKNALEFCEKNGLFLGEGSPTAKILFVGKEAGWNKDIMGNPDEIKTEKDLLQREEPSVRYNLDCLKKGNEYLENFRADALKSWPNSPTWRNYERLVKEISGKDFGKYHFLEHCFMTELSQIPLPNSDFLKEKGLDDSIRIASVEKRKELFRQPFFRNFPIVIMACGHYPREVKFDIEKTFNVEWTPETRVVSPQNYYNLHYGKILDGKDKILIHTRQVSMGVTNDLLSEIARECKKYYSADADL